MKPQKYKVWDKEEKRFCEDYHFHLAPNGQLYYGSMNVTEHYDVVWCTGLQDHNGDDIYWRDIVLVFLTGESYQVVWDETGSGFIFSNIDEEKGKHGAIDYYEIEEIASALGIGLIGSIYTHPELLEA